MALIVVVAVPWSLARRFPHVSVRSPFPTLEELRVGVELLTTHRTAWSQGDSVYLMSAPLPLPPALARLYAEEDEIEAVRFVHERTSADDAVYVGKQDHRKNFFSPLRPAWILGRRIGVKYMCLEPGLTTEPKIQQEMIEDLRRNSVEWIILSDNIEGDPDFVERAYRGSDQLDRYIRDEFEPVKRFGRYAIFERRAADGST